MPWAARSPSIIDHTDSDFDNPQKRDEHIRTSLCMKFQKHPGILMSVETSSVTK